MYDRLPTWHTQSNCRWGSRMVHIRCLVTFNHPTYPLFLTDTLITNSVGPAVTNGASDAHMLLLHHTACTAVADIAVATSDTDVACFPANTAVSTAAAFPIDKVAAAAAAATPAATVFSVCN